MKKGFTLIELLAVIVILAIIAIIATPIVLNIISNSKENAQLRSAEFYLDAAEYAIANSVLNNNNIEDGIYFIMEDGNICLGEIKDKKCSGDILKVEVKGEKPTRGTIAIEKGQIVNKLSTDDEKKTELTINNKTIVKNEENKLVYIEDNVSDESNSIISNSLAANIIKKYGGIDSIKSLSATWREAAPSTPTYTYVTRNTVCYATKYKFDKEKGLYTLDGEIVKATLAECKDGTKTCGKYTLAKAKETDSLPYIYEITSFDTTVANKLDYLTAQKQGRENDFSGTVKSGLYKAEDDFGTSYYFNGDINDNYVKFGKYNEDMTLKLLNWDDWSYYDIVVPAGSEMYWRIIRINGDGTIRLIYDGTSAMPNSENNPAVITHTPYSTLTGDASSILYSSSSVKNVVETWYNTHLKTNYGKYVADTAFCNDTNDSNNDNNYDPYDRLNVDISYYSPTLKCSQESDRLTVANGKLSHPVGLITADEIEFSGHTYLSNSHTFWTMTPSANSLGEYEDDDISIFMYLVSGGTLENGSPLSWGEGHAGLHHARPVINLKADVKFKGTGEIGSPYEIIME